MEGRLTFRRRHFLQRRLVEARCRRQGWHLRQRRCRGDVSPDQDACQRRGTRRQQAQLYADIRQGPVPPGKRLLVGDHVRRQNTAPDREPYQSLPHQFADAAGNENESRWISDSLHPEGLAGQSERSQLVARAQRHHLLSDASVLAKRNTALDPSAWLRDVAAASYPSRAIVITLQRWPEPTRGNWRNIAIALNDL